MRDLEQVAEILCASVSSSTDFYRAILQIKCIMLKTVPGT